jgi:hypothetical protein
MAIRVVAAGTTIVKRIIIGTPTRIGQASSGNLVNLDDVDNSLLSSTNTYLVWNENTAKFEFQNFNNDVVNVVNQQTNVVTDLQFASETAELTISTGSEAQFTATLDLDAFNTDNLTEGNTLYYTDARARESVSVVSDLASYDNNTGVITVDDANIARTDINEDFNAGINLPGAVNKITFSGTADIFQNDNNFFIRLVADSAGAPAGDMFLVTRDGRSIILRDYDSDHTLAAFNDNSSVDLYYWNQLKFQTAAHGITSHGSILPGTDGIYDLGSPTNRFNTLYLTGQTIDLGGGLISYDSDNNTFLFQTSSEETIPLSLAGNTTTDLTEGDNLYYTTARADSAFDDRLAIKSTTDLAEGDNLYYTKVRVDSDVNQGFVDRTTTNLVEGDNLYYTKSRVDSDVNQGFVYRTTTALAEGDNLYYTDARARAAISLSTDSDLFSYDSITGVLTVQETKIARTDREETFDAGINIPDGQKINFDNGSSDIFENGNDFFIRRSNVGAVGSIYVMTSDSGTFHVQSYDGNRSLAHFIDHGGVQLYNDGILKLEVKENTVEIANNLQVGNDVVILGNLQVDGTQTVINSTTISINDKNIVLADSAADSSAAHGGGITIAGANATILYNSVTDTFDLNKPLGATRNHLENFSTTDLVEGNNLYYTDARANSAFDDRLEIKSTDDLAEGDNLYYTKDRIDSDVNQGFVYRSTTDLVEGNNLYYTPDRADSDAKNALVGGTGITYTAATGTIDITNTTVVAGTYGSASLVPVLTINAQGQIDSAGTVSVAGVSSTSYDSSTGILTINTADGGVFNTTLHDSADLISRARYALGASDAGGDGSFAYDATTGVFTYTGPSASEVRSHFSAGGDLAYDSATGIFSVDVAQGYTKVNFDSDWNDALDQAALNGTGLTFDSATNTLSITATGVNAGTYGSASQVPVFTVNAQGQIDSAGSVSVAGVSTFTFDSASATLNIGTADGGSFNARIGLEAFSTTSLAEGDNLYYTTDRADSDAKNAVSGGTGITYTASTGVIDITDTSIVAGTYGSSSGIPVFTVNSRGQIDSAGVVPVAGVSSVSFDSASGVLTVSTADGGTFNTTILDSDLTASRTRSVISAIDTGGDGSFTYDSATGAFTYTGPSATDVRAHFSAGTGVTLSSGVISIGQAVDSAANVNFNTATVNNITIDGTTIYGESYGSISINTDQFKGSATQTVFNIVSDSENASVVLALGIDNQYDHAIGTTGTAAANDFVVGLSGTNTTFKIKNNVGDTPFNLAGGTDLLTISTDGKVNFTSSTEAASKTSAAVTIVGGLGVDKNIRGQDIIAAGNITATGTLNGSLAAAALSGRSTTDLAEGTRLYYTNARVDSYINASIFTTDIQEGTRKYYTNVRTDSDAKHAISVNDAGGDGSLTYSAATGIINYTGPSAAEVRAHFSAGTGVTLSSGQISIGQAVGTGDSVEFAGGGITGNFSITGDLVVGGAYILNETTDLRVTNALIKLADSNTNNTVDIGVVGRYSADGGSTIRRAGFFRDATNGEWYTFTNLIQDNLDSAPAATTINISDPSFELGTWNFGALRGRYLGFDSDFRVFSTNYSVYDSDFTAVSSGRYAINTAAGSITVTLPGSPVTGDYVKLIDVGDWTANSVFVSRNGSTIEGYSDDFELDLGQSVIELIYINTTWQIYSSIGQRGEQGPKGDSADVATFASNSAAIAYSIALG